MLDFNDAPDNLPPDPGITRESIRADLVARLESILATLFPAGKKRKGKFLIGDVLGSPGDSLEVVLDGEKAGLGELFDAERLERAQEGVDLALVSGHLDHERIGRVVDDVRAEQAHHLEHARTGLVVGADLDQHVLTLDG